MSLARNNTLTACIKSEFKSSASYVIPQNTIHNSFGNMKSHPGIDDIDADIFCTSDTNIETTFVYSIDDFVESDVLYNNEGIRLFVRNDHWILNK